jgi:low affinity Fe/Cu permease
MRPTKSQSWFTRFAKATARVTGRPATFLLAMAVILTWIITGPVFRFSDTWQLVINTGTTIVTFLMVFLIQATQNRDSEAVQVKLDELLRVTAGAHNALLDLEELEEHELNRIRAGYQLLAQRARAGLREGRADTGAPEVG